MSKVGAIKSHIKTVIVAFIKYYPFPLSFSKVIQIYISNRVYKEENMHGHDANCQNTQAMEHIKY